MACFEKLVRDCVSEVINGGKRCYRCEVETKDFAKCPICHDFDEDDLPCECCGGYGKLCLKCAAELGPPKRRLTREEIEEMFRP